MNALRIVIAVTGMALLVSTPGSSASVSTCAKQIVTCAKACITAYCPGGKGVPG